VLKNLLSGRSKRFQVRGAREIDERRRTYAVRWSEAIEGNEADEPCSTAWQEAAQGLARLAGSAPDAGRYRHVCLEPGRLDHPPLRTGIAVSKMLWLRYARENGYGVVFKTPAAAVPAGDVDYHFTVYFHLAVGFHRNRS
jgi:hypothetical protein